MWMFKLTGKENFSQQWLSLHDHLLGIFTVQLVVYTMITTVSRMYRRKRNFSDSQQVNRGLTERWPPRNNMNPSSIHRPQRDLSIDVGFKVNRWPISFKIKRGEGMLGFPFGVRFGVEWQKLNLGSYRVGQRRGERVEQRQSVRKIGSDHSISSHIWRR